MTRRAAFLAPVVVLTALALLTACAPEGDGAAPSGGSSGTPTAAAPETPEATEATLSPEAGGEAPAADGTVVSTTVIPRDCTGILGSQARTALEGVPLNDAAFGDTGALADGSLRCVWGDPNADTAKIVTTIRHAPENPVIEFLNTLTGIGFTCYEPDAGVRCEKTWENARYPVTDGRTLYFRDGVLIDTQFSHLAPGGFTGGIVSSLWPVAAPAPTP